MDTGRDRLRHNMEIPELHLERRQHGGGVLLRGRHQQLSAGRHRHKDDSPRQEQPQHHHLERHLGGPQPKRLPRTGESDTYSHKLPQLLAMRLFASWRQMRRTHMAIRGMRQRQQYIGTRGYNIKNLGRPTVLLQPERHSYRKSHRIDSQRLRKRRTEQTADGVCRRSTEIVEHHIGGKCRIRERLKRMEIFAEILHGDCLEQLKQMPDNYVDLIVTSPPYADQRKTTYGGVSVNHHVEWFIKLFTKEEDIVLDPFMGSGTTNFVAQRMHRNSIGIEIKSEYYEQVKEQLRECELMLFEKQTPYETKKI